MSMSEIQSYAIIQKADNFEHKAGDIVEVSLWRRVLALKYNRKTQKIIKGLFIYK